MSLSKTLYPLLSFVSTYDSGPILKYRLIVKYYLWSFSSFCCFKKGCGQLQAIYVHRVLVNRLVKLAQEKVWLGKLTILT